MQHENDLIILGGGIAGLSAAYFYQRGSTILEKEPVLGGLCRSFDLNGVKFDIGPHIIFSKNQQILDLHARLVRMRKLKRNNKVWHKGKYVKYPFENELSALPPSDRDYCLKTFIDNPYECYAADNMLQFFLKTFGEGITRTYLQPYNEKIWKFDPAYMDTKMVERIPRPPREDVIASAQGLITEGYKHQLNFLYPVRGGIESLVNGYVRRVKDKAKIVKRVQIERISKRAGIWHVETNKGVFWGKNLVSTIPIMELMDLIGAPKKIKERARLLKYNSIHVVAIQAKQDLMGDIFSLNVADKKYIFHRISKLNYLGPNYVLPQKGTTILVEITFRQDIKEGWLGSGDIIERAIKDLVQMKVLKRDDVIDATIKTFNYAYVIYTLNHRPNMDILMRYLRQRKITSIGRFAEFEYLNTDHVVERAQVAMRDLGI